MYLRFMVLIILVEENENNAFELAQNIKVKYFSQIASRHFQPERIIGDFDLQVC